MGLTVFNVHVQLMLYHWFQDQCAHRGVGQVAVPDFGAGLKALKLTNNLSWIPSLEDFPQLSALVRSHPPSRNPRGNENTPEEASVDKLRSI